MSNWVIRVCVHISAGMPDAWRHQRAVGTCALLRPLLCGLSPPLFPPCLRYRWHPLPRSIPCSLPWERDFFLKMARWQRPSYARTFGPIVRRMLCDPFEMPFDARIPFPSINMEFRAVETLPPPLRVMPAIRSQTSSSSGDNGIFLTISRTPRTLPP